MSLNMEMMKYTLKTMLVMINQNQNMKLLKSKQTTFLMLKKNMKTQRYWRKESKTLMP